MLRSKSASATAINSRLIFVRQIQKQYLAGEETAEGMEVTLVSGGHHLGDAHHQGSLGVTVLDAHAGDIVEGSFVQQLGSAHNNSRERTNYFFT
jgi:hypothetical protein